MKTDWSKEGMVEVIFQSDDSAETIKAEVK